MNNKGREFKGWMGGANYRRLSKLIGMGDKFYHKGIGDIKLDRGMRALDLGCGPGSLSFALAEKSHAGSEIYGVDISDDQLNYARNLTKNFKCRLKFSNNSMDDVPFKKEYFDIVMTSMAIHETPPDVRRSAIAETSRVLKKNGIFILIDWSKPRPGLWGIIWLPFICFGKMNEDNWNNIYADLCKKHGLILQEDTYINSLVRRQIFIKKGE